MAKEKRKVEDWDSDDKDRAHWLEWFFMLVLIILSVIVILVVLGPIIGNTYSEQSGLGN